MNNLEKVESRFADLRYMRHLQATLLRDIIVGHEVRDVLEIGFYHGKSSAYFAAILEDLGRGHLVTIDKENARGREPNINQVLSTLGLAHRVTPIFAHRSYTWELSKMIRATPRPQFDLCYFDGGHTWDPTGFGFLLVDMLLRPGGWIIFDDLEWTVQGALKRRANPPRRWLTFSPDERDTPAVRLVFDQLVPHLGYTDMRIVNDGRWGIARKPLTSERRKAPPGVLSRLLKGFKGRRFS
jgi:predicted O-methyltransferase YrrM